MNAKRLLNIVVGAVLMFSGTNCALAFYNPQTGRWLNRDPIEETFRVGLNGLANNSVTAADAEENTYAFVANSTQNYFDPLGLFQAALEGTETSPEEHNNYLRFSARCPVCEWVANVLIDYSGVETCIITAWIAQQIRTRTGPVPIITAPEEFRDRIGDGGSLGGLRGMQDRNCDAQPVQIQAWMRTRLVAGGVRGGVWRSLNQMPSPETSLDCYRRFTRVEFDCRPCGYE